MKFNFKRNILHVLTKNGIKKRFTHFSFFMKWLFLEIQIQIIKFRRNHFKHPFSFYLHKINSELVPGTKRKKNKLTFTNVLEFFNIKIIVQKMKIIPKHEYRKILKKQGLLYENK